MNFTDKELLTLGIPLEAIQHVREWSSKQDSIALSNECPECGAALQHLNTHHDGGATISCSAKPEHWVVNYNKKAYYALGQLAASKSS